MFKTVNSKVSLTTYAWTPIGKEILGVTGYWIDENSQLKELMIDAAFFLTKRNVQPPRITHKETEQLVPTKSSSSRIAARFVSVNHLIAYE